MGIVSGVLSLISLVISYFFTYESPVALISQDLDSDAQECLVKLRNEKYITLTIREDFHALKEMVSRDSRQEGSIYKISNFYFYILLKLLAITVFNYPLNMTRLAIVQSTVRPFFGYNLQSFLLALLRFIFGLVTVFIVDETGRRMILIWSIRFGAVIALPLAITFVSNAYMAMGIFNFIFECMTSFGLLTIVDVYSGEIFTTKKKGTGLSLVNCYEQVLHIILLNIGILVGLQFAVTTVFLFLTTILLVLFSFLHYPETKRLPLIEATKKFMGVKFNWKLY